MRSKNGLYRSLTPIEKSLCATRLTHQVLVWEASLVEREQERVVRAIDSTESLLIRKEHAALAAVRLDHLICEGLESSYALPSPLHLGSDMIILDSKSYNVLHWISYRCSYERTRSRRMRSIEAPSFICKVLSRMSLVLFRLNFEYLECFIWSMCSISDSFNRTADSATKPVQV